MAPVVSSLVTLLAILGTGVDAKPLIPPGRHAPPTVANLLSVSKRSWHNMLARYYGDRHGLTKPPPLPSKRAQTLPLGWSYYGCGVESWDERLLQGFAFSSQTLTTEQCLMQCQQRGFSIAGTEYGDECYCGDKFIGSGGAINPDSSCTKPCVGDTGTDCGQAWFLSLYMFNTTTICGKPTTDWNTTTSGNSTVPVGNSTTALPTSSHTTSASTPTSTKYEDSIDSSEWYALGCTTDSNDRVLDGKIYTHWDNMTIDSCLVYCEDAGFKFAGVEFGEECYCGASVSSTIEYNNTQCTMPCMGDSKETCGGNWAIELFELISSGDNTTCTTSSTSTSLQAGEGIANPTNKTTTHVASATTTHSTTKAGTDPTSKTTSSTTKTTASTTKTPSTTASTVPASGSTAPASSSSHNVWAHHMVGNTYPYTTSNWQSDIAAAKAAGIDGFALNMGSGDWESSRVSDAYSAAGSSGFKMFLSLDMTSLACGSTGDAANLVNLVKQFASQSAQAKHDGKVLVSTFAGSDCGINWQTDFVNALSSAGVDIFFVPSVFAPVSQFSSYSWMDGELNWNSGWPMSNSLLTTASDVEYMAALGSKEYMPAVSPFFFTHFGANSWNKNWLYMSDDWLYCTRWEQVISMRDKVQMTEILTWNDYGESSYIGPIQGALPAGSDAWVDGFDHSALSELTNYYATAFKTGSYPSITKDSIVLWTRPHFHDATASGDSVGKPTGWDWTSDYLYAVVLASSDSTVTLTSGSNSQTFSVSAGLSKLKISSATGGFSGSITRGGSTVASYSSPSSFSYTDNPVTYNYNYIVGSSS